MSGILINNMELPKKGHFLFQISANGDVWVSNRNDEGTGIIIAKAIELPPHGELMDKKAFFESEKGRTVVIGRAGERAIRELYERIVKAPAVVEAST